MSYENTYAKWAADPETFWLKAAEAIEWIEKPSKALDVGNAPFHRWFSDGVCNTCFNAVDRHVASGRGTQIAIIHDSPATGTRQTITYAELGERVARLAGALVARGVCKGDRVIIYMPMIPETVIAMLACARIGAIHSVVFGGFAAHELAVRIDDAMPKAMIAGSCGIELSRVVEYKPLLDSAIAQAHHKPEFCIIHQRPQAEAALIEGRDIEWEVAQKGVTPAGCVPVGGADPLYILYTSGTTGRPKGVVRPNGGHMVALHWTMKNIFDVAPGEVYWAASDIGWVVGHSYIVYAPLLHGNTTVIFEGKPVGTPDAGAFWRVISEHDVKCLFTAPTALRAIKRDDSKGVEFGKYDISGLRSLFLAGERADPDTIHWAKTHLGVPVIDHWWQTETGFPITAVPLGIEAPEPRVGASGLPMPGYDIQVLGEDGREMPRGELGAVCVKLPLPPGTFPTLWNADRRYLKSYMTSFPGYYETGDAGIMDADGYLYIMARTDDVINVAGHRLSTGQMEEVLAGHADVAECAVIGVADELKGQLPLGFLCLNAGCTRLHEDVIGECVALIRDKIGPVAAFRLACVINRLPKTRSGKILRGTMAAIADGREWKMPATIDDPVILDEISEALTGLGYA